MRVGDKNGVVQASFCLGIVTKESANAVKGRIFKHCAAGRMDFFPAFPEPAWSSVPAWQVANGNAK